jgi:hypothetical protein
MTRAALGSCFGAAALAAVVRANLGQDAPLRLLVGKYHFDRNAFEQAFEFLEEQKAAVISGLAAGRPDRARRAFGRLTHAVQDFYAHTNYAALWLAANPDHDPASGPPVNPVDPAILHSEKFTVAWVYKPWEALALIAACVPILERRLPADSHARMNLDHPGRGPLFPFAISAATERTRLEFAEIAARILAELGADRLAAFQEMKTDE